MKILNASQITELHAARAAKGEGFAPSLEACLEAAADGRLYDVDTQGRGADCLTIADDEDSALAEVAMHVDADASTAHPDGAAAWAAERGWTAERLALDAEACERFDRLSMGCCPSCGARLVRVDERGVGGFIEATEIFCRRRECRVWHSNYSRSMGAGVSQVEADIASRAIPASEG